ncbi:MAG TPA: Plug domain-containing protein, partial [Steroidobacteraceae bacterium]
MPRTRGGWASVALVAAAMAAAADTPVKVTDLLQALGATGIEVLYSSDLVPPGLESSAPLQGSDALSRAINALAEHHLILRRVEPRRYIVTREPHLPTSVTAKAAPSKEAPSSKQAPLDELTVFSSRYAFESVLTGEPIALTQSDMQRVPGSQEDALRAIRASPGLATNLSSRPYIRGAFLDDVLVQYDGIPLVDPFHFKNFQSLISVFDPAAVGRVDVYTGGFPVKYGTRSAGVLDLTPRSLDSGYEYRVGASLLSYDLSTMGRAERWPIEWLATFRHS